MNHIDFKFAEEFDEGMAEEKVTLFIYIPAMIHAVELKGNQTYT